MEIIPLSPQVSPIWLKLLEQYQSDVFHSPDWLSVLTETYGFDLHAVVQLNGSGEPEAGIPFCKVEDIKQQRVVTLPFSDYCDPLVKSYDQWLALTEPLLEGSSPYTIRCLHNEVALLDKRFVLANKAKWHGMDLGEDIDALWSALHSSSRRAVRKARREGVTVRVAQEEKDLRCFYELHRDVRKYKYQMVAQPYRFFLNIWHKMITAGKGALMLAVHQEKVIGGVLFLIWKNRLYYKFNASAQAHLQVRPNDLIIWEGINYGKSQGLDYLDFGLSDWDQESLVRYKRKFASEEKTISMLRSQSCRGTTFQEQEINRLLPQLTDLFTDESVPDTITEKAGDILYRFFT